MFYAHTHTHTHMHACRHTHSSVLFKTHELVSARFDSLYFLYFTGTHSLQEPLAVFTLINSYFNTVILGSLILPASANSHTSQELYVLLIQKVASTFNFGEIDSA